VDRAVGGEGDKDLIVTDSCRGHSGVHAEGQSRVRHTVARMQRDRDEDRG
jgi:hypothetical protein